MRRPPKLSAASFALIFLLAHRHFGSGTIRGYSKDCYTSRRIDISKADDMSSTKAERQDLDVSAAIALLIDESRSRPIVPFLGSGFSFASGFPTITGVIEYLSRIDFAIQFDLYKHRYPHFVEGRDYKEHPSYFVEDFGWPPLNDLNAELWNWLSRDDSTAKNAIANSGPLGSDLMDDLFSPSTKIDFRDSLTAITQWSKRRVLFDKDSGTRVATRTQWLEWKKWYIGESKVRPDMLSGDWDEMLERICEGNLDLVDSLFSSFENGRQPALCHRYMSFLIDKLSVPIVLTTNFDSFLETTLRQAGITHRVFDIHRDASLPHVSLVKRQLSVLKLHGSAYGLRVGERLTYPVESYAQESMLSYLPDEPLILVAGFSGSERRMTQMLKSLAIERGNGERFPRMLWLEGPGDRKPMLKQLSDEVGDQIRFAKIADITTFLQHTFFTYAGGYQASDNPYQALPGRPTLSSPETRLESTASFAEVRMDARKPVHVFATAQKHSSWAGLAIAQFAAEKAKDGYSVIWIDMEKHHTVPGTVAEILQKARAVDPGSPTFALFSNETQALDDDTREKAVKRIREILKRGRYVLVLDSLESYARPQFQHHGIPSFSLNDPKLSTSPLWQDVVDGINTAQTHYHARLEALRLFLKSLLCWNSKGDSSHHFYDSYICLSIGVPVGRHDRKASVALKDMRKLVKEFQGSIFPHVKLNIQGTDDYSDLNMSSLSLRAGGLRQLTSPGSIPNRWIGKDADEKLPHFRVRLRSFLSLKLQLRAIQQADTAIEREHYVDVFQRDVQCRDALLGVLAVFRRARSIACIRSMTERWLIGVEAGASASQLNDIRSAIDGLLSRQVIFGPELCSDAPFGMLNEGASIWLFRDVQVAWYRAMTNSLSVSEWITEYFARLADTPAKTCDDAVNTLVDGIACVALHIEASRVYYADTFMPSHDLDAFYEYLYHRCWAIRTLSLMRQVLLADFGDRDPYKELEVIYETDLQEVMRQMQGRHCHVEPDRRTPFAEFGLFSSISSRAEAIPEGHKDFEEALTTLQTHCVVTLVGALHRQERFLLRHATPETLEGWLVQMRQIVIPEMDCSIYAAFVKSVGSSDLVDAFDQLRKFIDQLEKRLRRRKVEEPPTVGATLDTVQVPEENAKLAQEEAAFLWSGLDSREEERLWQLERAYAKGKPSESLANLHRARELAWKYEVALRQTMRDSDLDARHRSCALAMLARSEYLLGHFRQAHHRLDLAGGGLTESPMHQASRSLLHAYRAELLIYSADDHYAATSRKYLGGDIRVLDVMKELRKVLRADREIRRAAQLIHDAENLSRWRTLWSLGMAQIQIEKLLFESEAIFVRRKPITPRQYSETFGAFERTLLDGLRSLRSALDEMPFLESSYPEAKRMAVPPKGTERSRTFEFRVESKVWGLWRQFYVVAAYFDSLLGLFSKTPVLTGSAQSYQGDCIRILHLICDGTVAFSNERWQYWNQSVRFEDFATIGNESSVDVPWRPTLPRTPLDSQTIRDASFGSLRRVQTIAMERDVSEKQISAMWRMRRPKLKSHPKSIE